MNLALSLNSQFSAPQLLEFCLRIVVAALCGAAIGAERTRRLKEAGLRTHIIVCAAAALVMIVSKYGFADLSAADAAFPGTRGADPARLAAQVISGISFIGAGVIFRHGGTVTGLTTAAGVWATAGIGLAVGAGMYWLGIFMAALVALLQIAMHRFNFGIETYAVNRLRVTLTADGSFREALQQRLRDWRAVTIESKLMRGADGSFLWDLTLMMPRGISTDELFAFAREHGEIVEISETYSM